ncbi:anaerobic ribonucleoside-triphosphate reductase activating protein [Patescibacteria group bacterium]
MIIGGLQKFSLLDYPEHLSAIIFTQGCNFRCQFCYNPMLVEPKGLQELQNKASNTEELKRGHPQVEQIQGAINEDDLFYFLKKRAGKLDAVVITGGEPTIHADLPEFIQRVKALNYKIKLDTNGTNPEMLIRLINSGLVDYIAMDIKAHEHKYDIVTGIQPDLSKIKNSIRIIKENRIPYEFRTTLVPKLLNYEDIRKLGEMIEGAESWYLQQFWGETDLINISFENTPPYTEEEMDQMCYLGSKFVKACNIR